MNHKLRRSAVQAAELALVACAVWAGGLAWAQSSTTPAANPPPPPGANGQEPPRHGPPPEALAACKSLASGAACAFTSPRGAERGSCFAPEGKPLACRPARPQGEGKPGQTDAPPRPKPAH